MPYLISDGERVALHAGDNTLGGHRANTVACAALLKVPPVAVLTIGDGASPIVRRLASDAALIVDGQALGWVPRPVRQGSKIEVMGRVLMFDAGTLEPEVAEEPVEATQAHAALVVPRAAPPARDGRLVHLRTGTEHGVPDTGLLLGRESSCDVVIPAKEVTRRHATVTLSPTGYVVFDQSANGTFVNDERVTGSQVLRPGDVVRIGPEEFRFDAVAASPADAAAPVADPAATVRMMAISPGGAPPRGPGQSGVDESTALATLQRVRWGRAGATFRVERPVCAIGRGERSDIRLDDGSVSAAHASLLLKGGTWYVVDLGSKNGTYVDAYRVAGERALTAGCTLRIGDVKLIFRPTGRAARPSGGTRRVGGFRGWRLEQLKQIL
jgi:pSer/pThr/pTyr-binding forkhead associated (FHA) protein